jgi:hypothetical protein
MLREDRYVGKMGEVARRAAGQGGHISRSQLLEIGLTAPAIEYRINTGDLKPVANGVYRVFPPSNHVDLVQGALLALPKAVASHQSAAHLLSLPYLPHPVPTVTVASHTTHFFPGVVVRRTDDLSRKHTAKAGGIRVTNVARTVFDLAGILDETEFDRVAEACLLERRVRMEGLSEMLTTLGRRGKPGTVVFRRFLQLRQGGDPRASKLELAGRAALERGGLPRPVPQAPVPWDPSRRFDDAYPEWRLAIEWDSRQWHSQRAAMEADRRRDRQAAAHGWVILRFTWQEVANSPSEVVGTVRSLLEQRRVAS